MADFTGETLRRDRGFWPYACLLVATDGTGIRETKHGSEASLRTEIEAYADRIAAGKPYPAGQIPGTIIVDGLPPCVWQTWAGWDTTTYEKRLTARLPEDPSRRYQLRVSPRAYVWLMIAASEKTISSALQPDPGGRPGYYGLADVKIDPSLPDGGWAIRSADDGPFVGDSGVLRGPRA